MRLLILIIILTSCKSYEFGHHEYITNLELRELDSSLNDFRLQNGHWPSQNDMDSLRQKNNYLKRFSFIQINNHPTYDTLLNITFKLEYPQFEDPIQSLEMSQELIAARGEYLHSTRWRLNNLVIQNNINLGMRIKLSPSESKKYRQWEQKRRTTRQLKIQNLRTKEVGDLKVGNEVFVFTHKDSTVYDYFLIKKDSADKEYYSDKWSIDTTRYSTIKREYYPRKWIMTTINTSDSTINIEQGDIKKRIKITNIDSLSINTKQGTYKIIGVNDTAHNTVFK